MTYNSRLIFATFIGMNAGAALGLSIALIVEAANANDNHLAGTPSVTFGCFAAMGAGIGGLIGFFAYLLTHPQEEAQEAQRLIKEGQPTYYHNFPRPCM